MSVPSTPMLAYKARYSGGISKRFLGKGRVDPLTSRILRNYATILSAKGEVALCSRLSAAGGPGHPRNRPIRRKPSVRSSTSHPMDEVKEEQTESRVLQMWDAEDQSPVVQMAEASAATYPAPTRRFITTVRAMYAKGGDLLSLGGEPWIPYTAAASGEMFAVFVQEVLVHQVTPASVPLVREDQPGQSAGCGHLPQLFPIQTDGLA